MHNVGQFACCSVVSKFSKIVRYQISLGFRQKSQFTKMHRRIFQEYFSQILDHYWQVNCINYNLDRRRGMTSPLVVKISAVSRLVWKLSFALSYALFWIQVSIQSFPHNCLIYRKIYRKNKSGTIFDPQCSSLFFSLSLFTRSCALQAYTSNGVFKQNLLLYFTVSSQIYERLHKE